MQAWLVNGKETGAISPDDRGLAYGDGLFETIALRHGQARFLERHLVRLAIGCRLLAIPVPAQQLIEDQISSLTARRRTGTVKLIVTRGIGPRGYAPPERPSPTLAIGFSDDPAPAPDGGFEAGWVAVKCAVPMSGNRHLAGLKTLNRLDSVLARAECLARAAAEGIMLGPDRQVIGGSMSNLFMVRHGCVITPALDDAGIRGIMRGMVLDLAGEIGIPITERRVEPDELARADELFVTNSLIGIRPIRQLDGRPFSIGPVTRRLAAGLVASGIEECAS